MLIGFPPDGNYELCIVNYALFFSLCLHLSAEGNVFEFGVAFCVGEEGLGLAVVFDSDFRALDHVALLVDDLETHVVGLWRRGRRWRSRFFHFNHRQYYFI